MPPFIFRSLVFNLAFYIVTALSCVVLLPTLLLPRKYFLQVVHLFVYTTEFLEKTILGLRFEVRGLEHLPLSGSFLVAAKHQSAYETTKLHILFNDPAIVLKKELLRIPLWGWYLAKSDVIAIDRSSPKAAVLSIQEGAKRMALQGRPIVIFPQGTRVSVDETVEKRPYKIGIVRLQEATGLPIIPLALNTGIFWPRNSFFKKSGRVIFEFLPPVLAGGKDSEILVKLQNDIEKKSKELADEGLKSIPAGNRYKSFISALCILLVFGWVLNWFIAAFIVQNKVQEFIEDLSNDERLAGSTISTPEISGFPLQITLKLDEQKYNFKNDQSIKIQDLVAKSWPFMGMPITIKTGPIVTEMKQWNIPVSYDSLNGKFIIKGDTLHIIYTEINKANFSGKILGTVEITKPYPKLALDLNLKNYNTMLGELLESNAISKNDGNMANSILSLINSDDGINLKITSSGRDVYLGPFKIYQFDKSDFQKTLLANGEKSKISSKRIKQQIIKPDPDL